MVTPKKLGILIGITIFGISFGLLSLNWYRNAKVKKDEFEHPVGKININTASLQELQKLPGIGVVKASRIIEYRETYGGFKNIDEILNVKGIGPKTFEDIKEKITTNGG